MGKHIEGSAPNISKPCDPHPALRATLSQWEREWPQDVPLPLGEGGAKRRVRVAGMSPSFFGLLPQETGTEARTCPRPQTVRRQTGRYSWSRRLARCLRGVERQALENSSG